MRRLHRIRLALAGALCAALLPTTAAQAETTSPKTYNVWQWNVSGNKTHKGSTTTGMVTQAAASIVNRNADFASFNELCGKQFDALINELRLKGWPQDPANFARFEPSIQAGTAVCGGQAYGNAIFSKRPLGAADRIALARDNSGSDGGPEERRNLLCAEVTDGSGTRFCTTHITIDVNVKATQLTEVHTKLEEYHAAGDTVLIAGDFNAQPWYQALNTYYSSSLNVPVNNENNVGEYRELDDNDSGNCPGIGEWTADGTPSTKPKCGEKAKLDLIFVRESSLAGPYSADSLAISTTCTGGTACSDHRILTGTVTVN